MSSNEFRYTWNDHIREGLLDQYRGAVGRFEKAKKASQMPTTCNPDALQSPELEPDPETLQSVDEKGMAFYVNQLACQLIDGDVAGTTEYFKDAGAGANIVQLIEKATGFAKTQAKEFFSLAAAKVSPTTVSENVPNPESRSSAAAADAAKEAAPGEAPPISREVAQKYIVEQLENLFNNIELLHLKFILGNAMVTYWRTLVQDDIMNLASDQALATNARMIAEIEIEWLGKMLMSIRSKIKIKSDAEKRSNAIRTFFKRTTKLNDEQVTQLVAAIEQDLGAINERRTPKEMPSTVAYIQSLPSNVQKSATQGVVNWLKRSKFALGRDSVAKLGAARSQLEPSDYDVDVFKAPETGGPSASATAAEEEPTGEEDGEFVPGPQGYMDLDAVRKMFGSASDQGSELEDFFNSSNEFKSESKWPKKAASDSNVLLRPDVDTLEEFGLIYDRFLYAYSEAARENQTPKWEDVEKQIKTNPNLIEIARMITNFGRDDDAVRQKFYELLAVEKQKKPSPPAAPADVEKLRQKFQQGPQESKQYPSEQKQNNRWKQLSGIK